MLDLNELGAQNRTYRGYDQHCLNCGYMDSRCMSLGMLGTSGHLLASLPTQNLQGVCPFNSSSIVGTPRGQGARIRVRWVQGIY